MPGQEAGMNSGKNRKSKNWAKRENYCYRISITKTVIMFVPIIKENNY